MPAKSRANPWHFREISCFSWFPFRFSDWIIKGDWKLILPDQRMFKNAKPELYQLKDDPWETKDLAIAEPERVNRMRDLLDAWWKP